MIKKHKVVYVCEKCDAYSEHPIVRCKQCGGRTLRKVLVEKVINK